VVGVAVLAGLAVAAALIGLRDTGAGDDEKAVRKPAPARTVPLTRMKAPRHGAAEPTAKPKPKPARKPTPRRPARKTAHPPAAVSHKTPKPKASPKGTSTKPRSRAAPARHFVPARIFAWPAKRGAAAYLVRFFRGSKIVFVKRTAKERITLPQTFRFVPGNYRWLVIPLDKKGRRGAPIVASHFTVGGKS
jgi:hypothetical protein